MFGWKPKGVKAQAEILDAGTRVGALALRDGYAFGTYEYQVELRPPGQPTHRGVATGLACSGCPPEPGDILEVTYYAKGPATFVLDQDERFVPAVVAKQHVDSAAAEEAEYVHLEKKGGRGMATVTAIRRARHRFGNVETHFDVRVAPKSGDPFDSTVVEWIYEELPPSRPKVGERRRVLFDPDDQSRITWLD
jgi:hypothetical protein